MYPKRVQGKLQLWQQGFYLIPPEGTCQHTNQIIEIFLQSGKYFYQKK